MRLLFLIALLLMSAVLYLFFDGNFQRPGALEQIRLAPEDEVAGIRLRDAEGTELWFEKDATGTWLLNGKEGVDRMAVRDMINALQRIQVRGPVSSVDREQVMESLEEFGIRVNVYAARHWVNLPGNLHLIRRKKQVSALIIGPDISERTGTYVSAVGTPLPYEAYLPGRDDGIRQFFMMDPYAWRNPEVLRLTPSEIRMVEVEFPDQPVESYRLVLEEDAFFFYDHRGEAAAAGSINTDRLERFLNAFRNVYAERLLPVAEQQKPDDRLTEHPFFILSVTNTLGEKKELHFFRRQAVDDGTLMSDKRDFDPNRFYLQVNGEDMALAQYFVFQPLMRPYSYFIAPPEPAEAKKSEEK
ncbi:MAG: hypothetical protein RG741_09155 [Bacteroidales bacterium]|nr:hypothetical protein [Bacteroidales bacterium]